MADVVKISGGPEEAKIRSVFGVLGLTFITLGIYWWVWYYKTNRELADLGKKHGTEELGTSPGKSLLAVTLGLIIIVPALVSLWNHWGRLKAAQRLVSVPESDQGSGVLALLLYLFVGFVYPSYVQHELNKVWARQEPAAGAVAEAPAPVEA